jgi:hypothetical protein
MFHSHTLLLPLTISIQINQNITQYNNKTLTSYIKSLLKITITPL